MEDAPPAVWPLQWLPLFVPVPSLRPTLLELLQQNTTDCLLCVLVHVI